MVNLRTSLIEGLRWCYRELYIGTLEGRNLLERPWKGSDQMDGRDRLTAGDIPTNKDVVEKEKGALEAAQTNNRGY